MKFQQNNIVVIAPKNLVILITTNFSTHFSPRANFKNKTTVKMQFCDFLS